MNEPSIVEVLAPRSQKKCRDMDPCHPLIWRHIRLTAGPSTGRLAEHPGSVPALSDRGPLEIEHHQQLTRRNDARPIVNLKCQDIALVAAHKVVRTTRLRHCE